MASDKLNPGRVQRWLCLDGKVTDLWSRGKRVKFPVEGIDGQHLRWGSFSAVRVEMRFTSQIYWPFQFPLVSSCPWKRSPCQDIRNKTNLKDWFNCCGGLCERWTLSTSTMNTDSFFAHCFRVYHNLHLNLSLSLRSNLWNCNPKMIFSRCFL